MVDIGEGYIISVRLRHYFATTEKGLRYGG